MSNSINYLKFDFRLIKESLKMYALAPAVFCVIFMFSGKAYTMSTSYVFFFLIILATVPFSMQANEKSTQMYYMFPSRISDMVRGRFLYLICVAIIIFLIDGALVAYLYMVNKFQSFEVLVMFICGILSLATCFIQYPIYYKFGMEKGKAISIIIYLLPAFVIFSLPSFMIDSNYFIAENLTNSVAFIKNNSIEIVLLSGLLLSVIGYISYLISCKICKEKEI